MALMGNGEGSAPEQKVKHADFLPKHLPYNKTNTCFGVLLVCVHKSVHFFVSRCYFNFS